MILIMGLLTLILIASINYGYTKHILHPAFVHASIWVYQLTGLLIFKDRFIEPSPVAIIVIVFGSVIFSFGSNFYLNTIIGKGKVAFYRIINRDMRLFQFIVIVTAICAYNQYEIFSNLSSGVSFDRGLIIVRTIISEEGENVYGLFKYGNAIALASLILLQILMMRNGTNFIRILVFVCLFIAGSVMAILSTGRGSLAHIFMLLGLAYILCSEKKLMGRKLGLTALSIIIITFLIFWIMGNSMGKAGDSVGEALADVVSYQFSSIPALSVYLNKNNIPLLNPDFGYGTFRFFFSILASLGLADKPPSLVQEFVNVPTPTNIYTGYLLPIKDFGWIGMIIIPLLLGWLHGRIFRWAMSNRDNHFALYILVISYLPLLQSMGGETYFSLFGYWIQFLIIGLVITRKTSKFKKLINGK